MLQKSLRLRGPFTSLAEFVWLLWNNDPYFFRCAVYGMILVEELDVQMIPMSPEFMWLPIQFVPKVASQMAKNQLLDIR